MTRHNKIPSNIKSTQIPSTGLLSLRLSLPLPCPFPFFSFCKTFHSLSSLYLSFPFLTQQQPKQQIFFLFIFCSACCWWNYKREIEREIQNKKGRGRSGSAPPEMGSMEVEERRLSLVLGLNDSSLREGSWGVVVGPRRCAAASEECELGWVNIFVASQILSSWKTFQYILLLEVETIQTNTKYIFFK